MSKQNFILFELLPYSLAFNSINQYTIIISSITQKRGLTVQSAHLLYSSRRSWHCTAVNCSKTVKWRDGFCFVFPTGGVSIFSKRDDGRLRCRLEQLTRNKSSIVFGARRKFRAISLGAEIVWRGRMCVCPDELVLSL